MVPAAPMASPDARRLTFSAIACQVRESNRESADVPGVSRTTTLSNRNGFERNANPPFRIRYLHRQLEAATMAWEDEDAESNGGYGEEENRRRSLPFIE